MKNQFKLSGITLAVLAALASGQVMAEAIVTSNGTNQTDRIAYDIPTNTAGMNISGNAATATSATSASTAGAASSLGTLRLQGNSDGTVGIEGVEISSNLAGPVGAADQAYITVRTNGQADVVGSTQAAMISGGSSVVVNASNNTARLNGGVDAAMTAGANYISTSAANGNYLNGDTVINGATTLNSSLGVLGQTTTNGIGNTGTLTQTGTTNINTTGSALTTIGNAADANSKTVIQTDGASITVWDTANTILGTTNINTTGTSSTTIGSAANTSEVRLVSGTSSIVTSNAANTINGVLNVDSNGATAQSSGNGLLNVTNSNSVNMGVASGAATMGGNFAATSSQASMTANNGGFGVTTYGTGQAASGLMSNGNAASRLVVTTAATAAGDTISNTIKGNTLVDGNMYINGTLVYSSNTAATTTVTGTSTVAGTSVVNAGQTGNVVDANGKITTGTAAQATAALTVTNTLGNTHGIVVQESQTTVSGGNHSTSMTLNDSGARFSNSATGAPVTVTGVADGQQDFDAVNYRQLKSVAAGVAGVSAMANIPAVDQNKTFAVGAGIGQFQSQTALALGASYRFAPNAVVKASVSTASGNSTTKNTVYGVGAGFSW